MSFSAKKMFSCLLIALLSTAALAACNNSTATDGGGDKSSPAEKSNSPLNKGKYDPPITLTAVYNPPSNIKFKNGESITDNVHLKWARDTLGIDIKFLWTTETTDAFSTKMRLALSSNQDLPDVVPVRDNALAQELIDSGKFMQVDDLFNKYATDVWKKAMNEDPNVWNAYKRDGKSYGIPILGYAYNNDPVLWIREDWLKKLNLKAPTNIDELEKVMDAFTNQDPDGNGKKDTFGLSAGLKGSVNPGWMSDLGWLFGAYGALPDQWNDVNGKLEFGSIQPGAKTALQKVNEWINKGYLSKESVLYDAGKAADLFVSGKAGIIAGGHWMPVWPLDSLKKNVPGAEYKPYPIPVGPNNAAARRGTTTNTGVVLINKNSKHPEAFFVYQNYLFENYSNPKGGGTLENGLAEGYDWVKIDGKPVFDESKIPGGAVPVVNYTLTFEGGRVPSSYMDILTRVYDNGKPQTPFEERLVSHFTRDVQEAAKVVLSQKDISKIDQFTGAPTPAMKDKWDFLNQMENETYSKIMTGEFGIDEFDKFVQKWKSGGGDKVTSEVNDWYSKNKSK